MKPSRSWPHLRSRSKRDLLGERPIARNDFCGLVLSRVLTGYRVYSEGLSGFGERAEARHSPTTLATMPTISTFYGIAIRMYWSDPAPPHFHARYAGYEVVIEIATRMVLRGGLPSRALALTLEWTALHHKELLENWDICARKQTPKKIPPLL
ncbi:MAG: DUF4160 domain-containing protein [Gemmatimonadaceae bacterium]